MAPKHKELIYDYWSKSTLGNRMIKSDNVSDSDLLFLIPNNTKKRLGLPLTRIPLSHKKRMYKRRKIHQIMSFWMFDILDETLEEILKPRLNVEFYDTFVDFKNVGYGYKNSDISDIFRRELLYNIDVNERVLSYKKSY